MTIAIEQDVDQARMPVPQKALNLEATGLGPDLIASIIVKVLHSGEDSGMGLADRLALPYSILEPVLEKVRLEQLVEVKRASGTGTAGYRYALTDTGRDRALRYFEACGYVGPAPVPLAQYTAYMGDLRAQTHDVYRER